MLGKVLGPYPQNNGKQLILIVQYNEDGTFKEKKVISVPQYLKEYDNGLHRYENVNSIRTSKVIKQDPDVFLNKENTSYKCSTCGNLFSPFKLHREQINHFCSRKCRDRFQRKASKNWKIIYDKQIVIPVKSENQNKYYVIIENCPGSRSMFLVQCSQTQSITSEDTNGIIRHRLIYDINKAERVRPVVGHKKHFWVTDHGKLISKNTKTCVSQSVNTTGYMKYNTRIGSKDHRTFNFKVHRLVGKAFIPNPLNKPFINHIDGNKINNHHINLEWCTNQENALHARDNGLTNPLKGLDCPWSKLNIEQVMLARELYKTGQYTHKDLGQIFNLASSSMTRLLTNQTYVNI